MGRKNAVHPVLLVIDDDLDALRRISDQLHLRYSADYQSCASRRPSAPGEKLDDMRASGEQVALVLASQSLADDTGADLLAYVKHVHPRAKRGLLIEFGDWGVPHTADAVLNAMALGHIDYYVLKPWRSPDEFFHRTITEFLHEWRRNVGYGSAEVEIVGERWSPKVHELTTLLIRNGFPHVFYPSDSEAGRRILRECACEEEKVPVVRLLRKTILKDPSREELARAYGVATELVRRLRFRRDHHRRRSGRPGIGRGRILRGTATLVIEREAIGGQAGSSTLIRNYPGFSRGVSGAELAQRAYQQAWVFGAKLLLTKSVIGLQTLGPPPRRRAIRRQPGHRAVRRAGDRGHLPAPRNSRARRAERRGRLLRRGRVGRTVPRRPGGLHRRRRQLGRPGRDAPAPLRASRVPRRARLLARAEHVAVPARHDRRACGRHRGRCSRHR